MTTDVAAPGVKQRFTYYTSNFIAFLNKLPRQWELAVCSLFIFIFFFYFFFPPLSDFARIKKQGGRRGIGRGSGWNKEVEAHSLG